MTRKPCPYCPHALKDHNKKSGCTAVVQSRRPSFTDQCPCTRYPDKAGRWRR